MRRAAHAVLLAASILATSTRSEAAPLEGRWTLEARDRGDHVQLNLRRSWSERGGHGSWSWTDDFARSDLRGLPASRSADGPVSLALVRDAGTLHLEGRLDHGRGEGRFTFEPDASFVADLKRAGYETPTDEQLVRMCAENLGWSWIQGVRSAGIHASSIGDLLRLHDNGVTTEFVRGLAAADYGRLGMEEVIRLWVNGVSPEYIKGLGPGSGRRWPVEHLVRFRNNGLEASYVSALGPHFEAEDIVRLHNNGVEASYIRDIHALGYQSTSANDFVRLHNNGVSPAFVRRARELHGQVTTEELIRLRINGAQ
jgi:hypothetical protein